MRDPPVGFIWELNKTHRYNVIFFLLSLEYYRMFYNLLFFYFFSVFWILLKFRYIYFMKSKERAGEWIFFCVTSLRYPWYSGWGGWATFYLFGVAEANRSASRVLFRKYSRRGAWSLVSGKDLGWTVSNFFFYSSIFFYSRISDKFWPEKLNFKSQRVPI